MPRRRANTNRADDSARDDATAEGELRSSDAIRTGFIVLETAGLKAVEYAEVDGLAIFEGDIVLGTAEQAARFAEEIRRGSEAGQSDELILQGIGISDHRFRWPGGRVPFTIDSNLPNQARVADSIRHWEERTPIRFVQRTPANEAQLENWVTFQPGGGCSSNVGMQGGQQFITLGDGCSTGNTIHEIGHAVGLFHEQSREDRDRFVRINFENIKQGTQINFLQQITDGDDIGPYDYGSIMHYPTTAFSKNGLPTIEPLGGQEIGQRRGLSEGDLAAIRTMYPGLAPAEPVPARSGVQFRGPVPARQTRSWVTHSWPADWHVVWTVAPTGPIQGRGPQVEWKVQVERQTDRLLKYYLTVTNLTASAVDVEGRYDVLGASH